MKVFGTGSKKNRILEDLKDYEGYLNIGRQTAKQRKRNLLCLQRFPKAI